MSRAPAAAIMAASRRRSRAPIHDPSSSQALPLTRCGEQFDLDPTGLPLVECFVRFDGPHGWFPLGEYLRRIERAGGEEADELGDVAPMVAVAAPDREVALLKRAYGEAHRLRGEDPDHTDGSRLEGNPGCPLRRLRGCAAGMPVVPLVVRLGGHLVRLLFELLRGLRTDCPD